MATKRQILDSLHLGVDDVYFIEQSPNKANRFYSKEYLDKNKTIESQFGALIRELKQECDKTARTVIYCQTRKQCATLYRMFEVYLGQSIYHGNRSPKNQIVQMFHAGTPKPVKEYISHNMTQGDGHIRVLISTVAFGMGVDCKEVRRVVHFGPPKTIESYVQECGRAGRDGLPSTCVLLYSGLTSVHCDTTMKIFLESEKCLRKDLMSHFGFDNEPTLFALHECCNSCAKKFQCSNCGNIWSPYSEVFPKETTRRDRLTRVVNAEEKKILKQELLTFKQNNLKKVKLENMVTCPNVLLEFNIFHINRVLDKCHRLFSVQDIVECVEIWRHSYAVGILEIIKQVFGDTDIEMESLKEDELDVSVLSEWSQIRDDSTLIDMLDSYDLEGLDSFMDTTSSSVEDL